VSSQRIGRPGSEQAGIVLQSPNQFSRRHCRSPNWVALQSWMAKEFGHVLESFKALFCKFLWHKK
jgi:hypothetical protein